MEKIKSFQVDHTKLTKGVYVSRIDGDVVTYDIRMVKPNGGVYLENAPLHTFEHLFATYARNTSYGSEVVYVGPMGCRTGFYLLVREKVTRAQVLELLRDTMEWITQFEGEIPGAKEIECGNYRDHELSGAKRYAADLLEVLRGWTPEKMDYEV